MDSRTLISVLLEGICLHSKMSGQDLETRLGMELRGRMTGQELTESLMRLEDCFRWQKGGNTQ
jgi:hypothetical protein